MSVPDRHPVVVDPSLACEARGLDLCPMCQIGACSSCHELASKVTTPGFCLGFTVGLGAAWGDQLVAHRSQLHAVPDGLSERAAVLSEPMSVSVHAILRRPPSADEPVLVVGAGIIGLTATAALRSLVPGVEVTVLAKHPHQAAAATRAGASHVVVPDAGFDYLAELAEVSGGKIVGRKDNALLIDGFPAVVEAVGTGSSIGQSLRFAAQRGRVHFIGCAGVTTVDMAAAWFKELDVIGAYGHAADAYQGELIHSFDRALAILGTDGFEADRLVTHEFPLADLREACETARDKTSGAIKVALRP